LDHDLDAFPAYAGEETEMLTDTYQSLPSPRVTLSDVSFLFCIFLLLKRSVWKEMLGAAVQPSVQALALPASERERSQEKNNASGCRGGLA
jgi:hypothetical protein